ncbi:histone chaperone Chz1 [Schizosaccharomyces cryophilus OY26]|uniref:Histone chaperone Chz1 n=1 Tax=Schizosaccharomyces cryophilus (strain OY26 / ATCC MYA-4695 / CBS 11777 / NBRC 106824 / NRRL Y48691) TaxID=653667 RepID=S9VZV9_SCHCR|nr:histone chaperone Chz1 [Schizosaccharomyces cryophilus OY26]EPY51804.1 histone chaperone Chz1 [Schizosaccharomyces cryophilus OY26]
MPENNEKADIKGKGRVTEDFIPDIEDVEDDGDFEEMSSSEGELSEESMEEDEEGIADEPEDLTAIDPTNITSSSRTRNKKIDFSKALQEDEDLENEEDDEDYVPPQEGKI